MIKDIWHIKNKQPKTATNGGGKMNNDMKCPFCGERLQQTFSFNPPQFWCSNCYDPQHLNHHRQGTKELWQELIRTKKQLEFALNCLDYICKYIDCDYICGDVVKAKAKETLDQITALKQKD